MANGSEPRRARLAQNEVLYRNVNDRIEDLNQVFDAVAAIDGEWVCECSDMSCATPIKTTVAEYEAVRANPRTFMVAPGHVSREVERVVRGNSRFTVVEKLGAPAAVPQQITHEQQAGRRRLGRHSRVCSQALLTA